jgi:SAM-dependent methyltransferase
VTRARGLSFEPAPESRALVAQLAARIAPDARELIGWYRTYAANHVGRVALDTEIVREFVPSGSRVLDVGAVPLLLSAALTEIGYRVTGVDLAPERFGSSISALDLQMRACDVEREPLPLPDEAFDAVVMSELFEHLRIDPIFTLQEARRALRPGAVLLLSTPNLRSLKGIYNFLVRGKAYSCSGELFDEYAKLKRLGHMGHVREYTSREVTTFLRKVGFKVERLICRGRFNRGGPHLFLKAFPRLRPFITYVARKPE